jgi:hypothetical protein
MLKSKKSARKSTKKSNALPTIKTLDQAIERASAKAEVANILSLHGEMKSTGKELGKALIALRKKFTMTKGCGGWFSKFLQRNGIKRRTAYYAMDAAKGKKRNSKAAKAKRTQTTKSLVTKSATLQKQIAEKQKVLATPVKGKEQIASRLEVVTSLKSAEEQLADVNKKLGISPDDLAKSITDAFAEVNSVMKRIALLPVDSRTPYQTQMNAEALKLGFLSITSTKKETAAAFKHSTYATTFPVHNFATN